MHACPRVREPPSSFGAVALLGAEGVSGDQKGSRSTSHHVAAPGGRSCSLESVTTTVAVVLSSRAAMLARASFGERVSPRRHPNGALGRVTKPVRNDQPICSSPSLLSSLVSVSPCCRLPPRSAG